ncbi:MAG: hypothetical protein MO852_16410 [Candidatus Devosia euplotis]|nr:hypothetical protein [Candidatus Devosia euplotis]
MTMPEARHRAAIGVFATAADLDAVAARLLGQGISHCLTFTVAQSGGGDDPVPGNPPLSAATLDELRARFPAAMVLRVDLSGSARGEALVAQILLDSAAQSVQLHDL